MSENILVPIVVGIVLIIPAGVFNVMNRDPSRPQQVFFRTLLALGGGALAAAIPGLFSIDLKWGWQGAVAVSASGALGLVAFFYSRTPETFEPEKEKSNFQKTQISMKDKYVLILDDDRSGVSDYIELLRTYGYTVAIYGTPISFLDALDALGDKVSLLVVDIMLPSIQNLETLGLSNTDTQYGLESGWVFSERVLRSTDFNPNYRDIPLLIWSSIHLTPDAEERKAALEIKGAAVRYFEKFQSLEQFADCVHQMTTGK